MEQSVSLIKAVLNSDNQLVDSLIDIGADINSTSCEGDTPLHLAIAKGLGNITRLLLNNGSDVNIRNKEGKTPLFTAVESNNLTAVKLLLNKTNLNVIVFCNGASPLHFACEKGYESIVKEFLNDYRTMFWVNMRYEGDLPIHLAIRKGLTGVSLMLLDKCTCVNSFDKNGQTPLWCALINEHCDLVKILLNNYRVNPNIRYEGDLPLFYAIEHCMMDIVKLLVNSGANLTYRNSDKRNVLHLCAMKGLPELIQLFFDKGVDLNAVDSKGFTPFHYAVTQSNIDTIKLFITKGIDVERRVGDYYNGHTALQLAFKYNTLEVAKILIDNGADINAQDPRAHYALNRGGTLLHWVCRMSGRDNPTLLRFLVENGADLNFEGNDGRTPICLAVKHRMNLDDIKYLINNGARVNTVRGGTPLYWAFYMKYYDCAHLLIENGLDVNLPIDNYDNWSKRSTPLHMVCDLSTLQLLLSKGAPVNALDLDGNTPLHNAHTLPIAQCLVHNGADLTICNFQGDTPLHTARNALISEFLIENGIKANALNHKGYSPLHLVKDVIMAQILIDNGADVNCVSKEGRTILHSVSCNDSVSPYLVDFFVDKGLDPNSIDNNGDTPLKLCSMHYYNHRAASRLMDNGASFPLLNVDTNGYNLFYFQQLADLFMTLKTGQQVKKSLDVIRMYLPLNYKEENTNSTALHVAAQYGHQKFVQDALCNLPKSMYAFRLVNRMNVNARDVNGFTPLHMAAFKNHIHIVRSILFAGAIYNSRNVSGRTPYELAECIKIKSLLIKVEEAFDAVKHANIDRLSSIIKDEQNIINALNEEGCSLLHIACQQGSEEIISFLLSKGVDVTLINNSRQSALHVATSVNNHTLVLSIVKNFLQMVKSSKSLNQRSPVFTSDVDMKLSLFHDFINVRNLDDQTALHIAANVQSYEIVKTLIKFGVMVDSRDKHGKTPADLTNDKHLRDALVSVQLLFQDAKNGNKDFINNVKNYSEEANLVSSLTMNKFGCTLEEYLTLNGFDDIKQEMKTLKILRLPQEFIDKNPMEVVDDSESDDDLGFGLFD